VSQWPEETQKIEASHKSEETHYIEANKLEIAKETKKYLDF